LPQYKAGRWGRHGTATSPQWSEHRHQYLTQNQITDYTIEQSLQKFFKRNELNFRLHFDLALFKERYCCNEQADGNPFRNSHLFDAETNEWTQTVYFDSVEQPVRILCCPEDVRRCRQCTDKPNQLCSACHISLCHKCASCICYGQTAEIEMVLANDNMWGYTTDIIYKYQVTFLEAAIVQPCWTSMLVCYVEGDYGHLLGEELHQQQFRTRVRGIAHSFHLPWEEIVHELERNYIASDAAAQLPRTADCLKYILRVQLRVGNKVMDKALKKLTVRPFVLLQLLFFLIDHNHVAFQGKGNGNAQELRDRMQAAVQKMYPVDPSTSHLPEDAFFIFLSINKSVPRENFIFQLDF